MLNIIFGRENVPKELVPNTVLNSPWFFRNFKKPTWFDDPFVREFIYAIDKAKVLFGEALMDYKGDGISTEMISTGSKTLCCIYYHPERIFYGSLMGDNCLSFLVRVAQKQDITVMFEHYADFATEDIESGILTYRGNILHGQYDYDDAFSDWNATTQEDDYIDRLCDSGL